MKQRLLALLAAALVCLPLAACAGKTGQEEDEPPVGETEQQEQAEKPGFVLEGSYDIGLLLPDMSRAYYQEMDYGVRSVLEQNGYKVASLDAKGDQLLQLEQLGALVDKQVKAIFVAPVHWDNIRPGLYGAVEAGIPLINLDVPISDQDLVELLIYFDDDGTGVRLAEYAREQLPQGGQVLVLDRADDRPRQLRSDAFREALWNVDAFEILGTESCVSRNSAREAVNAYLRDYPDLALVMACDDELALGAAEATQGTEVAVYGVEGMPEAREAVGEGRMALTVLYRPRTLGITAANQTLGFLEGEDVMLTMEIPVELVDADSVELYSPTEWE